MTVILVLFTFITFLVIDYFLSRKKAPVFAAQQRPVRALAELPRLLPNMVNGFQVPENVRFHPGHTWALSESPNLVRVGIDDFASKLIGKVEAVSLPQRGQWIRQGQKLLSFKRDGVAVDMVSPIEGSVSDINEAVAANPAVATQDPYGEGWVVTVQSPDAKTNFRNLMGGALARWWMEEAAGRLLKRLPASMGSFALAQDGGVASDNLATGIPNEEYMKITREFFLT
jgi:glycine cleavage system H lipoate-binding protein